MNRSFENLFGGAGKMLVCDRDGTMTFEVDPDYEVPESDIHYYLEQLRIKSEKENQQKLSAFLGKFYINK